MMSLVQPAHDLTLAYEALRAQATGGLPASTPRGLALFVAAGCPTWMSAWQPLVTAVRRTAIPSSPVEPPSGSRAEVVQVLTEMALGRQKRWTS
jgi:hypothetical protein